MSPRPAKKDPLSFEQATARLEAIVARMDDPQTGLEEMIALVEEGTALVRSSRQLLAEAELRIHTLEHPDAAPATPATPASRTSRTRTQEGAPRNDNPHNDDGFSLI